MNVKRYIHPRNKYKRPPDYKKLAILYPEFRKVAITDLTGKVRIDFQKEESLRVLTETLLKHDFDLHVTIPPHKLNPAITLRLNYILWIEDLMEHSKLIMNEATGIDIGTGAICIYALLLAKIYKCHMIGTEVDKKSAEYAESCVKRNNLQDFINVLTVNSDGIFKNVVKEDKIYDFSMCNPPFFESEEDSNEIVKVLPPRNASTGNERELKIEGGEIGFVTRMIEESIELRNRIKIYSTMIGKKADLFSLKRLMNSKNIENMTWTEFCQGHTTRWGLAWSFLPKNVVDLSAAPVIRKNGKSMVPSLKKDYKALIAFSRMDKFSNVDDLISFLKTVTEELNMKLQEVPENNFDGWACRLIAGERTWEHARRKRRLAQRLALERSKNKNADHSETNVNKEATSNIIYVTEKNIETEQGNENILNETLSTKKKENEGSLDNEMFGKSIPSLVCKLLIEITSSEIDEQTVVETDVFRIWMVYENGSGGMEALQSLRQYLINKLEIKDKILHTSPKSIRRKRKKKNSSKDDER